MIDVIAAQRLDFEMLRSQVSKLFRYGPVEEVDAKKGYRVKWGDGPDGPFLSPWFPHPESGGQTQSWVPMSKGQTVLTIHPNGDPRQGFPIRGGFAGQNTPPSEDLLANVVKAFGITVTMKDGLVKIEGNLLVDGDVDFASGHVLHNDTNIGDSHVHGGIVRGGQDTDGPH